MRYICNEEVLYLRGNAPERIIMRTLIIVLVTLVSLSGADEHFMHWDYNDPTTTPVSYNHWIEVSDSLMTDVDYFWVYATNSLDLNDGNFGFATTSDPVPEEYLAKTHPVESCGVLGFRMRVDVDENPFGTTGDFLLLVNIPNYSARVTTPSHEATRYLNLGWIIAPYEANVVFIGEVVSLDRSTWASIKTSF